MFLLDLSVFFSTVMQEKNDLVKNCCSPFYSLRMEAKGVLLKIAREFVTEAVKETQSPKSQYET